MCNRLKVYRATGQSASTMDNRLHFMWNAPPVASWDPQRAAQAWLAAPKQGVQPISQKKKKVTVIRGASLEASGCWYRQHATGCGRKFSGLVAFHNCSNCGTHPEPRGSRGCCKGNPQHRMHPRHVLTLTQCRNLMPILLPATHSQIPATQV